MKNIAHMPVLVFLFVSCTSNVLTTKRVENIIHQMTLKEKIEFMGGDEGFNIRAFEKYGIPGIQMADGPVGVRNNGASTSFPASIELAASWDTAMAHSVGKAIAMETRARGVHILLAPGLNMIRSAMCGRNFEYLSEDPFSQVK